GVLTVTATEDTANELASADTDYTVTYEATIKDVSEETTLSGDGAVEVVDDREFPVEDDSSVSVAALSPEKTAVSEAGGTDSVDSVPAQSEGWYRLASSTLPAKKLSGVGSWSASDVYTSGDRA